MEGEELGQDRTIITGRKGLVPFDINFGPATKANNVNSYQFTYVRADRRAHVWTPVTQWSRMPSSAWKKKKTKTQKTKKNKKKNKHT